ncbi:MAG: EAL domain-containing protein [Alphaproteobacteria bacterium]|nr:MAG: EAL domain-containing protein [Alphaproteobacteria bacterium]
MLGEKSMQGKCDIPGSARIPVAILGFSSLILAASVWQGLDDFTRAGDVHAIAETAISLNIALMLFAWSQYREALRAWRAVGEASAEALVLETLDPHTGLLNRASFFDRAERLIGELRPGQSLGLLLIDLKRFGSINDAHGHKFGDELLRRVSESVLEVAPQAAICARLGGDEFALALPFDEDETGSLGTLAARVAERLQKPLEIAGVATGVRPAIGVASLEAARANISTLLGQADLAMNAGKKDQRCVTWFHPAMDQVARARSETESGLRAGIAKSEFVPFYQPQIEFATGRIVGFEMLARWKHPSGRLIGPDLFIPVAEEAGLISELSEALIRQALVDARDWDPAVMLSVNISPVQLRDTSFSARIADLLDEGRFPANRLDLEITRALVSPSPWTTLAQAIPRWRTCAPCLSMASRSTAVSASRSTGTRRVE